MLSFRFYSPIYILMFWVLPSSICAQNKVVPSENKLRYQEMEMIGFIHFTVNTFTDKEWGYGDESPQLFNPSNLDVDQWVRTAKMAGMKELILTAKHHDGFCLWPSSYSEHSVKNSPYKNGNGDVVREFVDACKKHDLKAGLYLSPWDRNHPDYGRPAYLAYYKRQLTELLSNYGEINELWLDGANGGDGYYGGARENRKIDPKTYYDWESIFSLAKNLQPQIKIFSDAGPDIHWIGNENGYAGETFWSTFTPDSIVIGHSNTAYLNQGDPNGTQWVVGQCDVSIRPGWFYHSSEDEAIKSIPALIDIYEKSVGRNSVLLLNIPPNNAGRISEMDSLRLFEFAQYLHQTYSYNLAENMPMIQEKTSTNSTEQTYILSAKEEIIFNRIVLKESVRSGQNIDHFVIEYWKNGSWFPLLTGTTIGYKRILKIADLHTSKLRIQIKSVTKMKAEISVDLHYSEY